MVKLSLHARMPLSSSMSLVQLEQDLNVDRYPTEDEKHKASQVEKRTGGNVRNLSKVFSQLYDPPQPVQTIMLAAFPSSTSSETQRIIESLPKVDFSKCVFREDCYDAPFSWIIRSLATSSRTAVYCNEVPDITFEEFKQAADQVTTETIVYHFEGRIPEVSLRCIRYLRLCYPHVKISVEVEKPGRPGILDMAKEADIVFYSKSWAQADGYAQPRECLQDQASLMKNASHLCLTWGSSGAAVLTLPDMEYHSTPAYDVRRHRGKREVVDTIGAGDTFAAGFLYGLYFHSRSRASDIAGQVRSTQEILKFANELAGRKVVQEGYAGLGMAMDGSFWKLDYGGESLESIVSAGDSATSGGVEETAGEEDRPSGGEVGDLVESDLESEGGYEARDTSGSHTGNDSENDSGGETSDLPPKRSEIGMKLSTRKPFIRRRKQAGNLQSH